MAVISELKLKSKNLLDESKSETGSLVAVDGSNYDTINRARSPFVYLEKGNYTISMSSDIRATTMFFYSQPQASGYFIGKYATTPIIQNGRRVATFPVEQDCYVRCVFVPEDETKITDLSATTLSEYNVMIEQGSEATEYQPYGYLDIKKYNNETIREIVHKDNKVEGLPNGNYHFAKANEVTNGVCENAVNEPIINMQVSGNSVQPLLPLEYQQVEYLENSGTQRIDVGLVPTNSTSIDITYQSMQPTGASQYIAGSRVNAGAILEYIINGSSSSTYWDVRLGGVTTTLTNISRMSEKIRSYLQLNNGVGIWTLTRVTAGTTYTKTISSAKVNATANLFLFAYNNIDANTHVNLRIYTCKIYEKDVLVRNYVPCYRKVDNVAGLYDLVTNEFYTNAGTGNFAIGANYESTPSIEQPIEIQSVGNKTKNLFDIAKAENGTLASQNGTNLGADQYPNRCRSGFIYLTAGSYVVSFNELLSTGNYLHRYSSNNQDSWLSSLTFTKSGNISKFTLEEDCYIRFTIQPIDTSSSLILNTETLAKYKPQLEKNFEPTQYEPYGYKIHINIYSDNLANEKTILENKLIGNSANGNINDSTTYNTLYMEVEENKTYVFENFVRADGTWLKGCFYDSNGAWVSAFEETTVTIPTGVKYVGRSFSNTVEVQLYLIHSQTEIYLNEPLRKINDIADVLDYKNKKVIRNVGSIIYNATESWSKYDSGNGYMETNDLFPDGKPVLCNMFVNSQTLIKTLAIRKNYANIYVYGVYDYYLTQAEWHAFLSENNMEVIGQLVTPTEENIEVPEISTLDGTTILNIETRLEPSAVVVRYWKQI